MGIRSLLLTALVLFALVGELPCAEAQSTFGAEWTFAITDQFRNSDSLTVENVQQASDAHERAARALATLCHQTAGCRSRPDAKRFEFNDGLWFELTTDPGVLEVRATPMTLEQAHSWGPRIQSFLFDTMDQLGYRPHDRLGGGHIHLGMESAFGRDVRLFRNFLVDWSNHPDVQLRIFRTDTLNAPPIQLTPRMREKFASVITDFDASYAQGAPWDITHLSREIIRRVYLVESPTLHHREQPQIRGRYQSANLQRIIQDDPDTDPRTWPSDATLELRAFNPVPNFQQWIERCEILQSRLRFLSRAQGLVDFVPIPAPMDAPPLVTASAFRAYVTESGLPFENYEGHLTSEQRQALAQVPLDSPPQEVRGRLRHQRWKTGSRVSWKPLPTCAPTPIERVLNFFRRS
jgi:hypothetical protein